jgi:hypothetical protein
MASLIIIVILVMGYMYISLQMFFKPIPQNENCLLQTIPSVTKHTFVPCFSILAAATKFAFKSLKITSCVSKERVFVVSVILFVAVDKEDFLFYSEN